MRTGILILGIVFVVVVLVINKAQEWRQRRRAALAKQGTQRDVLFDSVEDDNVRTEPHFETGLTYGPRARMDGMDAEDGPPTVPRTDPEFTDVLEQGIDEEIHAVIALDLDQPVSGDRVLQAFHGLRHAGRQPVSIWSAGTPRATRVTGGERLDAIAVAIQLANRSGPLNEIEYSEFVARLQHVAEQLGASCDVPDMRETIARARALDARCAPLDAQIGITVAHPQGYWSGELIDQRAREMGLVLRADGQYYALLADGHALYCLQNAEGAAFRADQLGALQSARLTFVLDLPCTPRGMEPFARMSGAAQVFADRLGGILVDDQLRTLTPAMLAGITRQIEPVYERLVEAGIPAGSQRALALFSQSR